MFCRALQRGRPTTTRAHTTHIQEDWGAMTEHIEIKGKKYAKPDVNRIKRGQAKQMKKIGARAESDLSALWDLLEVLVPGIPTEVVDDLEVGEVKQILTDAGVIQDTESNDPETVTMGESSASSS